MPDANGNFRGFSLSRRGASAWERAFRPDKTRHCFLCDCWWEEYAAEPKCPRCGNRDIAALAP